MPKGDNNIANNNKKVNALHAFKMRDMSMPMPIKRPFSFEKKAASLTYPTVPSRNRKAAFYNILDKLTSVKKAYKMGDVFKDGSILALRPFSLGYNGALFLNGAALRKDAE